MRVMSSPYACSVITTKYIEIKVEGRENVLSGGQRPRAALGRKKTLNVENL